MFGILLHFLLILQVSYNFNMANKDFSNKIIAFSSKFCNELQKNESVVASPLSAEYVLSLITLGSVEPSRSELLNALMIPDEEYIRSSFSTLSANLKSIKGVTLNVANKLYVREGGDSLNENMKNDAVQVFDADIELMNFMNGAAAANTINKWVEDKTNNRIKDLLTADALENVEVVTINALYFKGSWKNKFNPLATRDREFHINSQKSVKIPMMFNEDDYRYAESSELDAQLLEMPYEGNQASMLIILPTKVDGLADVLKKLAHGFDLNGAMEKMHSNKVNVGLPKFKIESTIDLTELLPKLGISTIFDKSRAGLTGILASKIPLYVSKAVQKAFIEVNEEGAEAAAATVMGVRKRRSAAMPREFIVSRPALWCVMAAQHVVLAAVYTPSPPAVAPPRDDL